MPDADARSGSGWGDLGQGLIEYGLILGLAAVVTLVILVVFGPALSDVIDFIVGAVDASS